jgi:16S rRNA (guanine(966)-N(2))-methyltransferase RsmD
MPELRVTGGELRGRMLQTPRGIRPTTGRVREALFNILGAHIHGAKVLDLFAGSGALGIEALSRGAESADLVERNSAHAKVIAANLEAMDLRARARVHCVSARSWLEGQGTAAARFDVILMDPEYGDAGEPWSTVAWWDGNGRFGRDAVLVAEHRSRPPSEPSLEHLRLVRRARYGDSELSFYRAQAETEGSG